MIDQAGKYSRQVPGRLGGPVITGELSCLEGLVPKNMFGPEGPEVLWEQIGRNPQAGGFF